MPKESMERSGRGRPYKEQARQQHTLKDGGVQPSTLLILHQNLMVKIDMAKAYDRLVWSFLLNVIKASGFMDQWMKLISNCITLSSFSIMMNGTYCGYFRSSKAL